VKDKSDIDLVVYMLDMCILLLYGGSLGHISNMYTTKSISDLSFTSVPLPREPLYNKSIHISNMYTTKSISDLSFGTAVKDKSDIDLVVYMLDMCILLL
jgi:hypothetical protein